MHVPRMPHERFQGKSSPGCRGDSMLQFDWRIGELKQALDHLSLAESTLIALGFKKEILPWLEQPEWSAGYGWFSLVIDTLQDTSYALRDQSGAPAACGRYCPAT